MNRMTGIQKRIDRISFFWFNVFYIEKTELHQFSKETIFGLLIQNSPKRMHPCLCPLFGIDLNFHKNGAGKWFQVWTEDRARSPSGAVWTWLGMIWPYRIEFSNFLYHRVQSKCVYNAPGLVLEFQSTVYVLPEENRKGNVKNNLPGVTKILIHGEM